MSKPTIAFFGATGGCGLSTLHRAIGAGYPCIALVRDASKLKKLLAEKGISDEAIQANLTIVEGAAQDGNAVEQALLAPNNVDGRLVDIVISALGATPQFQMSITKPMTIDQPTLCGDCAQVLVQSVEKLQAKSPQASQPKPLVVVVSTTGITNGKRDVPVALMPLYHILLPVPHRDKERMEAQVQEAAKKPNSPFSGVVTLRPTLLTDGQSKGIERIKYGTEDQPALGYGITRDDVGVFIFEKIIKDQGRDQWRNKNITLTL